MPPDMVTVILSHHDIRYIAISTRKPRRPRREPRRPGFRVVSHWRSLRGDVENANFVTALPEVASGNKVVNDTFACPKCAYPEFRRSRHDHLH